LSVSGCLEFRASAIESEFSKKFFKSVNQFLKQTRKKRKWGGLGAAERLGIKAFEEARRVEVGPHRTQDDAKAVIRAAYSQVLGNEYLMSSERLTSAESLLLPRGRFQ
jgi:hypothetical protein